MGTPPRTLVLPAEADPPCVCGCTRVRVFRDSLETLLDNMGCDLGLEPVTGLLCPECQASELRRARHPSPDPGSEK